jgi:hypothetical protein
MEITDILRNIQEEMYNRQRKCIKPSIILIHPATYMILFRYVSQSFYFNPSTKLVILGLEVKRCININENEIEVY